MDYEIWGEKDGDLALVIIPINASEEQRKNAILEMEAPELKDRFWAKTWEEACRLIYEYNGWKKESKSIIQWPEHEGMGYD